MLRRPQRSVNRGTHRRSASAIRHSGVRYPAARAPTLQGGRTLDKRGLTRPARRELVRRGLAGLLLPLAGRSVATAASDHGAVVTPNPIKARIATSGLAVELVDLAAPPPTSAVPPR